MANKCKHQWIPTVQTARGRMIWGYCGLCGVPKYCPERKPTNKEAKPVISECNHLYRVSSPIDTVEVCERCHERRPCEPFTGDSHGPSLQGDQA